MIKALVQKDMTLFFRNQFFALITALGLVLYIGFYFLMPAEVDETLPFAVYVEGTSDDLLDGVAVGEGISLSSMPSREALIESVESGAHLVGLAVSAQDFTAMLLGRDAHLTVYYAPDIPQALRDAIQGILRTGIGANREAGVQMVTEVVGMVSDTPIPLRDRVLPTLLLLILATEVMGLGTIIVEEIEEKTAQAVLTTPLSMGQFLTSKVIVGVGLAFVQVFLIVSVTGTLFLAPLLMIITLLIGSVFVTGVGFLIASFARDMMSVIGWSMLLLVLLTLPSMVVVFPMVGADWMRFIPSYYLVDTLHRGMNFGASLADVSANLVILLLIGISTLGIGSLALRRRLQW